MMNAAIKRISWGLCAIIATISVPIFATFPLQNKTGETVTLIFDYRHKAEFEVVFLDNEVEAPLEYGLSHVMVFQTKPILPPLTQRATSVEGKSVTKYFIPKSTNLPLFDHTDVSKGEILRFPHRSPYYKSAYAEGIRYFLRKKSSTPGETFKKQLGVKSSKNLYDIDREGDRRLAAAEKHALREAKKAAAKAKSLATNPAQAE